MTLRWPGANIQVTAISQYWHPTGIIGKHRLTRTDLVIVDDIGLLPVSADAAATSQSTSMISIACAVPGSAIAGTTTLPNSNEIARTRRARKASMARRLS